MEKKKTSSTSPAGMDLTKALKTAPHDFELLEKFPVVGILEH